MKKKYCLQDYCRMSLRKWKLSYSLLICILPKELVYEISQFYYCEYHEYPEEVYENNDTYVSHFRSYVPIHDKIFEYNQEYFRRVYVIYTHPSPEKDYQISIWDKYDGDSEFRLTADDISLKDYIYTCSSSVYKTLIKYV